MLASKSRYILCFKTCPQMEIKNQRVFFFTKSSSYISPLPMLIFYFGRFLLNNAYHAYNCMLTEKLLMPYTCIHNQTT